MTVTAYRATATNIPLGDYFTVVVQLRLPNTGNFVVFGRVTITNSATTAETCNVELTTLDGATVLDEALIGIPPGAAGNMACVTVQGFLNLSLPGDNEIVDIRCASGGPNVTAYSCSLIAISVDQLSG